MNENILKIESLSMKYNEKTVLEDINFEVKKGEFLSLLGPSGCGKTTLLKILIGIEQATQGKIYKYTDGETVEINNLSPAKRNIGIVFQNYALFPNMNIFENIAYALKTRKLPKEEIDKKVNEIIKTFELTEHVAKKPKELSGGQQQRVAMARTLVLNPDIVLLDEPMSALDAEIKLSLRKMLKALQEKTGITMIYVTHDQEEAFDLSDRIMLLENAKIVQLDTPYQLYHNPKSDFVKRFIIDHLDQKMNSIKESISHEGK